MQTAAAAVRIRPGLGPETVQIEWLPDEVLELLFCFADPKTLLMTIPAVSAWGGRASRRPALCQGVYVGPVSCARVWLVGERDLFWRRGETLVRVPVHPRI